MAKKKGGTPLRKKKTRSARSKKSKKAKPGRVLEMLTARIEGAISDLDVGPPTRQFHSLDDHFVWARPISRLCAAYPRPASAEPC
jgi:hypothetical protein